MKNDPNEMHNIVHEHVKALQTEPLQHKKMMSVIASIEKRVKQKMSAVAKKNKPLDKEVEDQLKALGYL